MSARGMGAPMPPSSLPKTPAASAPDLIGPTSILNQPVQGPRGPRRRRARPYRHVHFGISLEGTALKPSTSSIVRRLESWTREQELIEKGDLWGIVARCLHAFSAAGFQFVERWETEPGGPLELPGRHRGRRIEPVGHLLRAVQSPEWAGRAAADTFLVQLSGNQAARADLRVRRVHRQRHHAISVDLNGLVTHAELERLLGALRERLDVRTADITKVMYA